MFVPYATASTITSPSFAPSRLVVETFAPFFAEAFTSAAVFSAASGLTSTNVTECPPDTRRVPMPRPIFPAPMIVISILTLLIMSDIIQLYSKQQMLYNLLFLLIQVNRQKVESVG